MARGLEILAALKELESAKATFNDAAANVRVQYADPAKNEQKFFDVAEAQAQMVAAERVFESLLRNFVQTTPPARF